MKWYEKQKQLYAQKNQSEEPVAPREETYTSSYVEPTQQEEPTYASEMNTPQQETYENMAGEDTYEETNYSDQQLDEMLHDSPPVYEEDPYPSVEIPPIENDEVTTISKGTQITGNIETDYDLIVRGHIKGDIICNANLSVYGVIEGTISCANAYFEEAIIVGDIGCSGNLELTSTTTIDGNVEAYELMNGGRIKGNAIVSQSIHFLSTSAIVGDISANDIDIERGAIIQGNINIRQEVYFEN